MNNTSLSSLLKVALALGVWPNPTIAETGYECFRPDERVRSVFFHQGRFLASVDNSQRDSLRVSLAHDSQALVQVKRGAESMTISVAAYGNEQTWLMPDGEMLHLVRILAAQLNEDAKTDLVVELSAQGNGLAADRSTIVLLFSGSGGFQAVALDTYNFEPQSFVVLGAEPTVQWIQTLFMQAPGTDTKEHSFWVHRLWSLRYDCLILNEAFPPRIYQFTHRPNQEETPLLLESVKSGLLSNLNINPIRLHALP